MPVDLHRESSAIFVAKPSGDRRNVNISLNTRGGEEVPEVVVGYIRRAHLKGCWSKGTTHIAHAEHGIGTSLPPFPAAHALQELA